MPSHVERRTVRGERGMAAIHLVIAVLFCLALIAIADLLRYDAAVARLDDALEDGLTAATKLPDLDIDYRGLAESDPEYQRYRLTRKAVTDMAEKAVATSSSLISPTALPSGDALLPITMVDRSVDEDGNEIRFSPYRARSAFLRPGECAQVVGRARVCNKTTFRLPPNVKDWRSPEQLLERYPVMVAMAAEVKAFFPFVGSLVVVRTASEKRLPILRARPMAPAELTPPVFSPDPPRTPRRAQDEPRCKETLCGAMIGLRISEQTGAPQKMSDRPFSPGKECPPDDCMPEPITEDQYDR